MVGYAQRLHIIKPLGKTTYLLLDIQCVTDHNIESSGNILFVLFNLKIINFIDIKSRLTDLITESTRESCE